MSEIPQYETNDGCTIPAIGFGTYPMKGATATAAVEAALQRGYRLIDTAVNYENEDAVGRAVHGSALARENILVTTKLPGRFHGYDETINSCRDSLAALGLDYLDLYLIHWPNPSVGKFVESWKAMIALKGEGLVRSIGVSNFTPAYLRRLQEETGVLPAVNQVELHPYFPQEELRAFHESVGVQTESWSPLGRARAVLGEQPIVAAAARLGVTPAQVVLRWHVQLGSVPIPKSEDLQRQQQNIDIFDFELSAEEVQAISALGRPDGRLFDADPERHEEM